MYGLELSDEFVASMFGEVLGEEASLSMEVEEEEDIWWKSSCSRNRGKYITWRFEVFIEHRLKQQIPVILCGGLADVKAAWLSTSPELISARFLVVELTDEDSCLLSSFHMESYCNRNMEMEPDIENMTMSEYLEYEAAKERRLWDDVRSRRSPTNYYEAGVDSFHRNKNDLFRTGAENIKRMGHDIVQDSIWEHDDDSEEDQEEDGDDEDTFYMWDIMVKDVERSTIGEEVDPTKDLKELERLLAMRPQSNFTEIQVDRDITSPGRLKHAKLILGYRDACEIRIRLIPIVGGGDDDGMIAPRMDLEHGLEHAISSSYRAIPEKFLGLEVGSIRRIQGLDTAYWGFLGVGTTLDIFQNIIFIPYFQYGVLVFWIRRIELYSFVVFGECRHGYAVSSLMDTAYWSSE
ncbi:hypothetical protein Tco_0846484 [Tanacetum coccineum]